jgi:hypothetical protein
VRIRPTRTGINPLRRCRVICAGLKRQYPDDKPFPSCLIYGETFSGEPVHSVWAYNQENQWAVLITVYRPDPRRWIDWRTRRPKDAPIQ